MSKLTVAAAAVVVALAAGAGGYVVVQNQVDQSLAELKERGVDVSYDSLSFTASGWATLNTVKANVSGQELTADQVQFELLTSDQNWTASNLQFVGLPNAVTVAHVEGAASKLEADSTEGVVSFSAQGIQLPVAAIGDSEEEIASLKEVFGADHLAADLALSASYDAEKLKFNYAFGSPLFTFDLNGALGGVNFIDLARKMDADPAAAEAASGELMQLSLGHLALTLADSGLAEKMAAAQAKTQAISVDEVRGQWAAEISELTATLRGGEIQSANLWADELDKLASSWKGVSFRLTPAEPVPLMTLMMMAQGDPNQMVELLHPEFSAL